MQDTGECVLTTSLWGLKTSKNTEQVDKKEVDEIVESIIALLNSDGGKLELSYQNLSKSCISDYLRRVEQRLSELIGSTIVSKVQIKRQPLNVVINVKPADDLVTLNYNLYWPSETQVILLHPLEPVEKVKKIIEQENVPINETTLGSHRQKFVKDKDSELQENKCVQFKNLKSSPSKCVTLADRLVGKSNKFSSYVSAFANHAGGHIYLGIDDDGTVKGEKITNESKEEITKKVTKTVNKMIWPEHCGQPKKGKDWDIFFEHVEDDNGKTIWSTYVVVIYIGQCSGGVFIEKPKSFHVVNNKPESMSFDIWRKKVLSGESSKRINQQTKESRDVVVKRTVEYLAPICNELTSELGLALVPKVNWSSPTNKKVYRTLTRRLVRLRNDQNMDCFEALSERAIEKYPESGARLVVLAEKVAVAYKNHHFQKAFSLYRQFQRSLNMSKDYLIFEIRGRYLISRIERARGNFELSYEIAQFGLQNMQSLPAEFITVWFYMHAAALATILAGRKNISEGEHKQRANEALEYLERALDDANKLEDFQTEMTDLQHKLHIYKVCTLLGCPLSGEAVDQKYITPGAIKAAALELEAVDRLVVNEDLMSCFRNIQLFLAKWDLSRRQAEVAEDPVLQFQYLKRAFQFGEQARNRARALHFEEMVHYAGTRLTDVTEQLIRTGMRARKYGSKDIFDDFEDSLRN